MFSIRNTQWPRYNHDNHNSTADTQEKILKATNVGLLTQKWFNPSTQGDFIQAQPIIRDGVVYSYSSGTVLIAQRVSDGVILWATQLGLFSAGSAPLISGNLIYATTDENLSLHAINIANGTVVWSTVIDPTNAATGQGEVQGSISQVENLIIVPVDGGHAQDVAPIVIIRPTLNAFDPLTGQRIWSVIIDPVNGAGIGVWSTPSYDTKLKLMFHGVSNASRPPAGPYSDSLQARDYRTGQLVWSRQYTSNDVWSKEFPNGVGNPVYGVDRDVGASPNLFSYCKNGKKIKAVAVASKAGILQAFKRKNGKLLWRTILTPTPSISGNPGAALGIDTDKLNGILYVAFNNDPGPSLTPELYLQIVNGDFTNIIEFLQALFVGTTGFISAVSICDGRVLWSVGYSSPTFGAPTYANGLVYQGWFNGTVRIFNGQTGTLVSSFTTPQVDPGFPFNLFTNNYPISVTIPIVDGELFVPFGIEFGITGGLAKYGLP